MKFIGPLFQKTYPARWVASILLLLVCDVCTYMAFRESSGTGLFPHQDKVLHALAFFGLTLLGHVAVHFDMFPRMRARVLPMLLNAGTWLAYGLFIELGQRLLTYRTFSLADLAADAVGIALACGLCRSADIYPRSAPSHG